MSSFKRIISFICTFAISISLLAVPASAATYTNTGTFWNWAYDHSHSWERQLIGLACNSVCPVTDDGYHYATEYVFENDSNSYVCKCIYCGEFFDAYDSDFAAMYDTYVSTLDSTVAQSTYTVTGYTCTLYNSFEDQSIPSYSYGFKMLVAYQTESMLKLITSLKPGRDLIITGMSDDYIFGFYFDETGLAYYGRFNNPYIIDASVFGVIPLSSLTLIDSIKFTSDYRSNYYLSEAYARAALSAQDFYDTSLGCFDSGVYTTSVAGYIPVRVKSKSSDVFSFKEEVCSASYAGYLGNVRTFVYPNFEYVTFNSSHVIVQPSTSSGEQVTVASRPVSVSGNYGIIGDDGTVVNVYNTVPYDEETLIFMEPQTGTQYQTTGWTYDYNERCYLLDLASGTMTVNDTDVAQVGIAYGDEEMLIGYIDASGNLLAYDTYAYLVETTSTDDGTTDDDGTDETPLFCLHDYVDEVTKEPTCTTSGETVSTCSKCGKVRTTAISPTGHSYSIKSSVPTSYDESGNVAVEGYTIYKCDNCDNEYKSTDNTGPDMDKDGFLSWLWKLIIKPIERVVDGLLGLFDFIFPEDGQGSLEFYNSPSTFSGVSVWES